MPPDPCAHASALVGYMRFLASPTPNAAPQVQKKYLPSTAPQTHHMNLQCPNGMERSSSSLHESITHNHNPYTNSVKTKSMNMQQQPKDASMRAGWKKQRGSLPGTYSGGRASLRGHRRTLPVPFPGTGLGSPPLHMPSATPRAPIGPRIPPCRKIKQ
jgi:hypothetical protein